MELPIIDLSYHEPPENIDYDVLASQISGAILRVAYGTGAPGKFEGADPAFETHYREMHKRGVPLGGFHFITEYQPMDAQVKLYLDSIKGKEFALGHWCNAEIESGADRLTAKSVIGWMNGVEAVVGRAGICTARWCWKDIMGSEYARYSDRLLWMMAYVINPYNYIPHGWKEYFYWQHTDKGWLKGCGNAVDLNRKGNQAMILTIPALSQVDDRWRYEKLGTSTSTIGGYGCLITSVSMMLKYFGFDTDPSRLNKLLASNGGFYNGNLFVWGSLSKLFPGVTFGYRYDGAALDKIDAQLALKKPVIIHVDFVPSTPAVDEHWVLVVGKQDGSYIINDPRDGKQLKFEDRYGDPRTKIFHVCTYNFDGSTPTMLYEVKVLISNLLIRNTPVKDTTRKNVVGTAVMNKVYPIYEEKDGYGRIGTARWIALDSSLVSKIGVPVEPAEPAEAEKLQKLWEAHPELH